MKELQVVGRSRTVDSENMTSENLRRTRGTKVITQVKARTPACSACEIPVLCVLSKAPEAGMPTKTVLQEVRSAKWFKLSDDDLKARYPGSKKRIVDNVIKFARKNLVMKDEVYPVHEGYPLAHGRLRRKDWSDSRRKKMVGGRDTRFTMPS